MIGAVAVDVRGSEAHPADAPDFYLPVAEHAPSIDDILACLERSILIWCSKFFERW